MEIKIRRIDKTVIVVADSILQRNLPHGEKGEDIYSEIVNTIRGINSGLLDYNSLVENKIKLLDLMNPKEIIKVEKELCTNSEQEAIDLAHGDLKEDTRKDIMKKVSTIHNEFKYDEKGYAYLEGFTVPIPADLADALLDAHYNKESLYTVESLIRFWQWALLNPNELARNDLFKWFKTGEFVITESGLVLAYRCVNTKTKAINNELTTWVQEQYIKVKKWKKSPKHFTVAKKEGIYVLISNKNGDRIENYIGNLKKLYQDIPENEEGDIYTDAHTGKMTIKIGEEVSMPRKDCDENREAQCSRGLHFMSKKYGLGFGDTPLIVLVNPMNIVAFPSYDQRKGRCCAYMPVAKAIMKDGNIDTFDNGTFDFDYSKYTQESLETLLETGGLEEMQEKGLISKDISESDMVTLRANLHTLLKDKLIYV